MEKKGKYMVKQYLQELLKITVQQSKVLGEERIEEFEALSNEREKIICEMQERKMECSELTLEEKMLLEQINEIGQKNINLYNEKLEEVKRQIKYLNESSRQTAKYINSYPNLGIGRRFEK